MYIALPLLAAGLYVVLSKRISITHIILGTAVPSVIGAEMMRRQGLASSFAVNCLLLSPIILIVGYQVGQSRVRAETQERARPTRAEYHPLRATRFVVYAGVVYHFAVGGIPLLNANAEVARLNFTSSGLFGIPGRLYLFGLPIVAALTAAEARKVGTPIWAYRPARLAIAAFTLSRLLSGFKSGMLEVIITLILIRILSSTPLRPSAAVRRYLMPVLCAIAVAYMVGTSYDTYNAGTGAFNSFLQRLTTGSAASSAVVLDQQVPRLNDSSPALANDLRYYVDEYLHIGSGPPYSYEKLVSATLVDAAPTSPFLAPVTTGAFADLYYDLGLLNAGIGMLILGLILSSVTNLCRRWECAPLGYSLAFASAMALYAYITKGDLVYNAMNWTGVAVAIATTALVERALSKGLAMHAASRGRGPVPA